MGHFFGKVHFVLIPNKVQFDPNFWSQMVLWSCAMES